MKTNSIIQPLGVTTHNLLLSLAEKFKCDYIGFASAFCTVGGIRKLENIISEAKCRQILVGLDDYFTHPSAIKIMQSNYRCTVRIAGSSYTGKKFHPKIFFLGNTSLERQNAIVIGSANLTVDGLSSNVEAATIVESENLKEKRGLLDFWERTWAIGKDLDSQLLDQYEKEFVLNRKTVHRKSPKPPSNVLESDDAVIDPSYALTCWIEVGNITGFQAEQLEIKAEQALFFGLPPHGGPDTEIRVWLNDKSYVDIPTKYRHNAMWRLNLPDSIPEVNNGLRPKGRRSPYVAVFTRKNNLVSLKFINEKSSKFRKLKEKSTESGTLAKTTARLYGWF